MGKSVLGKNITVSILTGVTFARIFCAKSMTYSYQQDLIESTSKNSPNDREYEAGLGQATLTLNGILTTQIENGKVPVFYLMEDQVRRKLNLYQIVFEDEDGGLQVITFYGIIRRIDLNGDVLQWGQTSVEIQVSGNFELDQTIILGGASGFTYLSDWWVTVPGQKYCSVGAISSGTKGYLLTASDIVLEVDKEGKEFDLVTGVPGNEQARWNTSLLRMEFNTPFNPSATIFVFFKRPN